MSSWEVPFQGTTHKIWRRSDQNWGRRCDFCDSARIPQKCKKKLPKIQNSKYQQSPMSCFEGPPEADSVKVWWRSDQNWGRRYVFVIFLKIHQKNSPKIQKSKIHQTPMSCFERPPKEDSVKVWRRSDQNWERRCDLKLCLRRTADENWCL